MVNKIRQTVENNNENTNVSREDLCWASLSKSVKNVSDDIIKDYYEAESWQFSGCWD